MSEKHAATYHPTEPQYECPECGKRWATRSAATDCCGDWLGYD